MWQSAWFRPDSSRVSGDILRRMVTAIKPIFLSSLRAPLSSLEDAQICAGSRDVASLGPLRRPAQTDAGEAHRQFFS